MNLTVWDQPDALDQLRSAWQKLFDQCPDASVFLSWEWISTWWRHFHYGGQPHLLTFHEDDQLLGVAPLFLDAASTTVAFMAREETTDYADLLCLPAHREVLACQLLDHLHQNGSLVRLEPLPPESPLLEMADGFEREQVETCPTTTLAATWDDFLAGLRKKDRHELRRKIRRAEQAGQLAHQVACDPADLELPLREFYRLHRSSSDRKKAQFLEPHLQAFFTEAATDLARRGWLRLSTLRLDGTAIASLLSFDHGSTVSLYNSGLDPEFRSVSPGIVLIAYEIQDAIAAGKTTYDFMRGDEPYKYDFGSQDRFVWRLCLTPDLTPNS